MPWLCNMFMPDRGVKRYLIRNEKRQQCLCFVSLSSTQHPLDGGATPLKQCQKDDAFRESGKDRNSEFLMENVLLFRWKRHTVNEDPTKQLVLPKSYQDMALQTAHMIPMAGHLGRKKTQERFYINSSG